MEINSGLYIVTLNNLEPISVNAHDKRRAEKCIKVNRDHCKFGKASDFETRKNNYLKTFGSTNVNFCPFVKLIDTKRAEKIILKSLDEFRIRGNSGRRNEWLSGISILDLEKIILNELELNKIDYMKIVQK